MIQKVSKLAGFLYIDHCCEGIGWNRPQEDEEYVGIPHGYYEVGAMGCIEVYKKGKLLYSVNLSCVECIEFVVDEKMSEELKCPCCGGEASDFEQTGIVECEECMFMCDIKDLPRITAALELAKAVVKANEPYCISESPIKPDYNQAVFGRYVTSEINNAEQRVLEVFK